MNVLITGGTGSLGPALVRAVLEAGHRVTVLSRRAPHVVERSDVEWRRADITGFGLEAALQGVETIVHAASNARNSSVVDVGGTRNLVAAAGATGVGHLVYISIVGIDQIPFGYYRNKLAAEGVIKSSGVPFSILRATQFHSLIDRVLSAVARIPLVMPLAADFKFQPVAASEVADRLAACVDAGPRGLLADFGGPDVLSLGEMAETWKEMKGVRKVVIRLPVPGAVAAGFRAGKNTAPGWPRGSIRWRDWLIGRTAHSHAA